MLADRRRRLAAFGGALVVLVAGGVTATVVALRYAHGPRLANHGGSYGWAAPDNSTTRFVELGAYSGMVTEWRPGKRQAFVFNVTNDSAVTQTVLAVAADGDSGERLEVSPPGPWGPVVRRYLRLPVSIAPHETRLMRYSFISPGCVPDSRQSWDRVTLGVRVGWFTRTETVRLGHVIYEVRASAKGC